MAKNARIRHTTAGALTARLEAAPPLILLLVSQGSPVFLSRRAHGGALRDYGLVVAAPRQHEPNQ